MTFDTQGAAKRFVVAKVIEQAEREQVTLRAAERHMLSWSESDPDFVPDPTLAEAQENEIPEAEFKTKVAGLIRRAYDRPADVIPPPVDVQRFEIVEGGGDYYLVVAALVPYKRVDLAVAAATRLGRPLVIVGTGPEEARLRALAGQG